MGTIRVLIGILGLDQHEVGAVAVASMLRDAGMEVIYLGCYQTPDTLVSSAIQEDADVLGISCHSWEYLEYLPTLMQRLKAEGCDTAVVLGGSVITPGDVRTLMQQGVAAVFGPGSTPEEMISIIRALARKRADGASIQ